VKSLVLGKGKFFFKPATDEFFLHVIPKNMVEYFFFFKKGKEFAFETVQPVAISPVCWGVIQSLFLIF